MFVRIGKKGSLNKLPLCIRAPTSLVANIMDEIHVINQLKLKRGWCFIDVGAYVGSYSVLASRMVGEKGVVIAVEPSPYNFKALLLNTKIFKNVIPLRVAIYNKDKRKRLYYPSSTALSSLTPCAGKCVNFTEVKCVKLDTLYKEIVKGLFKINKVDAIKIDVEGAEKEVLEGGKEVLNLAKLIIVEIHGVCKMGEIKTLLNNEYGFRVRSLGRNHIIGSRTNITNKSFSKIGE